MGNYSSTLTSMGLLIPKPLPVKVIQPGDIKVKMSDVGGYHTAKMEAIEFVNFLKHPQQYEKLGARLPRGVLFHGPPGTGKTLIAKATAGEANIPFLACAAASLLIGDAGPDRLREIFEMAREHSPCVLYFDEMDCIGRDRRPCRNEPNPVLLGLCEELLVQLDGFETVIDSKKPVLVFGSTNNMTSIDSALMRPGRFDRTIRMNRPDSQARAAIFDVHLRPIVTKLDKDRLKLKLALRTPEFSGADVMAVCNEAAMIAAREGAEDVKLTHFDEAIDRTGSGTRDKRPQSHRIKRVRAYHEAGHAICSWFLEGAAPITKASIQPSTKGNQCSQMVWTQMQGPHVSGMPRTIILNNIATLVAGRVGEAMTSDKEDDYSGPNSMSDSDLRMATQLSLLTIIDNGMSDIMGLVSCKGAFTDYWSNPEPKISDAKQEAILKGVQKTLEEAEKLVQKTIEKHLDIFEKMTKVLEERESLNFDELEEILGPSPLSLEDITAGMEGMPDSLANWDD